jgi:hypothetical protein
LIPGFEADLVKNVAMANELICDAIKKNPMQWVRMPEGGRPGTEVRNDNEQKNVFMSTVLFLILIPVQEKKKTSVSNEGIEVPFRKSDRLRCIF